MTTKVQPLKRAAARQSAGERRAQPARIDALAPANIEQAADLGAGYVIVKLRPQAKRPGVIDSEAFQHEIPLMTRKRLVAALHRGRTLAGVKERLKRPADNEAFMRTMALQEQARRAELAGSGALIAARELADRLNVSPQAVSRALKAGRMFALECGGGHLLLPAFYADPGMARRDLETVTRALGELPASSKWQFFTTPKASLNGVTPLQALQQGELQAVLISAAGFAER